jgi:hypothetical protein
MAIVRNFGKPNLLITMTCNPNWPEVSDVLFAGQQPNDRPDLLARVFKHKLQTLLDDTLKRGVLGRTVAHIRTVEFQSVACHIHTYCCFWHRSTNCVRPMTTIVLSVPNCPTPTPNPSCL